MTCCSDPKLLVYKTVRRPSWTVRYKRCANCGTCSKTIQRGFIDERNWLERGDSLPDGHPIFNGDAIIKHVESVIHRQEVEG